MSSGTFAVAYMQFAGNYRSVTHVCSGKAVGAKFGKNANMIISVVVEYRQRECLLIEKKEQLFVIADS